MSKCPQCGGENVFPGKHFNVFGSIGPQYFRPRGLKILAIKGVDIPLGSRSSNACADCGLLWTRIDTAKLRKVLAESGGKAVREKVALRDGVG
jgi:hypothetical protein